VPKVLDLYNALKRNSPCATINQQRAGILTMKHKSFFIFLTLCLLGVGALGCARAARDTTGFGIVDKAVVNAPFEETWQATKAALKEKKLNLYTRDKRGVFVAFSEMKRQLRLFTPHRTKLTVNLRPLSSTSTEVQIETMNQVYGSTLLTYPDWHDRKAKDNSLALSILESIQSKVSTKDSPSKPEESSTNEVK